MGGKGREEEEDVAVSNSPINLIPSTFPHSPPPRRIRESALPSHLKENVGKSLSLNQKQKPSEFEVSTLTKLALFREVLQRELSSFPPPGYNSAQDNGANGGQTSVSPPPTVEQEEEEEVLLIDLDDEVVCKYAQGSWVSLLT